MTVVEALAITTIFGAALVLWTEQRNDKLKAENKKLRLNQMPLRGKNGKFVKNA
jgi:hypothetical protein